MSDVKNPRSSTPKVLLQVNGSIAAFKAVALTSKLVQAGFECEVILSKSATQFVGAASFEGLTRRKVHHSVFDEGQMMAHIDLERWADLILTYPASANFIAKIANGMADDLASTLYLAHEFKKPYWIAPAMNQAMWNHPAVQANVEALKTHGVAVLEPDAGTLACGEIGQGRLIEPEAMLAMIQAHFVTKARILVTAGGTVEAIDPVRSITNVSTGRTGYTIAKHLEQEGYSVHLVQSKNSAFQNGVTHVSTYTSSDDLAKLLNHELSQNEYDFVIHSAAVSDFKPDQTVPTKINSGDALSLNLVPTPKIVRNLRAWSKNKKLKLISFKLTSDSEPGLSNYDSEWIIHNELKNVGEQNHAGTVFEKTNSGDYVATQNFKTKSELSGLVLSLIRSGAEVRAKGDRL